MAAIQVQVRTVKKWSSSRWWVVGVTLLATALRLACLGSKSFWFDECFTYTVTLAPLKNSLSALLVSGIYSPLYFLLLRLVMALAGTSEYTFRFPSAAFGSLTVPAIYHLGRRLEGEGVGVIAALLLAVCPFHIWYSQDARMYAPMAFFSLAAMGCFVLLLRGQRRWVSFAVYSGLAYLMHYATFSMIYVQLIRLWPRLRTTQWMRRWFLVQMAALSPLTPWLIAYLVRGIRPTGLSWIPRPSLLAPFYTLWNFTVADVETFTLSVAILAAGTGAVFLSGLFPWNEARRLLVWWLVLPIGFLFVLSVSRSYYVDRYFMAGLPAYLLLLAMGIMARRRVVWRLGAASVVLAAMLWGTVRLYADPYFAKEAWRGATAAVDARLKPRDVVVLQDYETLIGTSVYRMHKWPSMVLGEEAAATLWEAETQYERVWLVWRSLRESNHRLSKSERFDVFTEASLPVCKWLAAHRDQVTFDLKLPGISVVRVDVETPR